MSKSRCSHANLPRKSSDNVLVVNLIFDSYGDHIQTCQCQSETLPPHEWIVYRVSLLFRWDSRGGSRPGPRDPGLQKSWIPGKDLGPGQIPQIYSNRPKFFDVPCPETSRHARCFPSPWEEFFFFQKNLFRRAPSRASQG